MSESPVAELRKAPMLRLVARPGPPLGLVFGGIGVLATLAVGLLHLDRLKLPLCYVKAFTGLPCPSCGSTRAVGRLFALDVPGAFAMNPLMALAAVTLAAWAVADLVLLPRRLVLGLEVGKPTGAVLRIAAVVALVLNWTYLLVAGR